MLWTITFRNNTKEGALKQENHAYFILNKHIGNNKDDYPMFNMQEAGSLSPSSLEMQSFKREGFVLFFFSNWKWDVGFPHFPDSRLEPHHFLLIARSVSEAWNPWKRDARTLAHCEHLTSDLRKWWKINGCRCAHPAVDRCSLYTPFRIPWCVWLQDDEHNCRMVWGSARVLEKLKFMLESGHTVLRQLALV